MTFCITIKKKKHVKFSINQRLSTWKYTTTCMYVYIKLSIHIHTCMYAYKYPMYYVLCLVPRTCLVLWTQPCKKRDSWALQIDTQKLSSERKRELIDHVSFWIYLQKILSWHQWRFSICKKHKILYQIQHNKQSKWDCDSLTIRLSIYLYFLVRTCKRE